MESLTKAVDCLRFAQGDLLEAHSELCRSNPIAAMITEESLGELARLIDKAARLRNLLGGES